ncbi:MAG: hypothetical protein JJT94_10420 [Bernardetiaceae bacterium]|nr:hypothetical protein [Bernardetiaceae bacterium]
MRTLFFVIAIIWLYSAGAPLIMGQSWAYRPDPAFSDFPTFQLRLSSGPSYALGGFASIDESPRSGFAGSGLHHDFALGFYPFRKAANQKRTVHCVGPIFGYSFGNNSFNQTPLNNIFHSLYDTPDALATTWQNHRSAWQRHHFNMGVSYIYLVAQRLMVGVDASFGAIVLRMPAYHIDNGNYVPEGWAHFFSEQRASPFGNNLGMAGSYSLSISYLVSDYIGIRTGGQFMHGSVMHESEVYDTWLTGNGLAIARRLESQRQPIRLFNLQLGVFLNVGSFWGKINREYYDDYD